MSNELFQLAVARPFWTVDGVERRKNQVTGFGRSEGDLDRLAIAHLSHEPIGRQPSVEYTRNGIERTQSFVRRAEVLRPPSEATTSESNRCCDSRDHETSRTTTCITLCNALMLWKTCADDVHMVWSACGNTRDAKKYLPTLQRFPHDRAIVQPPSHVVSLDATCLIRKMRPARPLLQSPTAVGQPSARSNHDRNC